MFISQSSRYSFSRPYHVLRDDSVSRILRPEPQYGVGYLPEVAILHAGYQKSDRPRRQILQSPAGQKQWKGFY